MRLMYHFIMTPLTFMYLTRKGTSDIMRSEHTRPYYTQLRQEWPTCCWLFFDPTHLNAEGVAGGGGGKEGGSRVIDDRAQLPGSISANPGLSCFNSDFFFFCSKAFARIIFAIPLENLIIKLYTKRIQPNLLLKLSYLNTNFAVSLGSVLTWLWTTQPWLSRQDYYYYYYSNLIWRHSLIGQQKHLHIRLY